jgi:hypothetical protein
VVTLRILTGDNPDPEKKRQEGVMSDEETRNKVDDQEESKDTPSPLSIPKIAVSRINRKIVMALLLIFGSLAALSLIWAFSPNKPSVENPASRKIPPNRRPRFRKTWLIPLQVTEELAAEGRHGEGGGVLYSRNASLMPDAPFPQRRMENPRMLHIRFQQTRATHPRAAGGP